MSDILQFASPCEAGIAPQDILAFLDDIKDRRMMVHSMLLIRHGKVCAEGYWHPFDKNTLHRMYSVSKTFVSAAVGAVIGEGKLSLDSKVAPFFTDKYEGELDPWLADATVRDLLRMETPHAESTYCFEDPDWLATFFRNKPNHPAGTFFRYDTSGTYTLDVLVQRLTGKGFLEYLKEKALDKIGFSKNAWVVEAPEGYPWGGSGVMCTARDLARFALLVDRDGEFEGEQLLPADYLREAKKKQIDNDVYGYTTPLSGHGYGYQIWRIFGNGYAFEGMGGQLALCWPDKDFIAVFTGDTQGHPMNYDVMVDALRYDIWNKLSDEPVAADPLGELRLSARLAMLEPVPQPGEPSVPFADEVNGRVYEMGPNKMGIERFSFVFEGDEGTFRYDTVRGPKEIRFGLGKYVIGEFPEDHYSGTRIRRSANRNYRCMATAAWTEAQKFVLRVYVIDDYFGNMAATFGFKGDEAGVIMTKYAEDFMQEYNGIGAAKLKK